LSENEKKQQEYFDELARRRRSDAIESKSRSYILEDVYSVLTKLPRALDILEIGCGDGSSGFTEYFVSKNLNVSFLDISAEAVRDLADKLEKAGHKGFRPFSGTFKEVAPQLIGETFDVIFFGDTLHHLTEDESIGLFDDLAPFMHKGSKVVAFEPNGHWPFWRLMPRYNKDFVWEVEKNIVHCTPGGFRYKFGAAGMRVEQYIYQRIVPLFVLDKAPFFKLINKILLKIPLIRVLSSYTIIVAGRADSL
jgi:SAM-dependent methyltransferase